MALPPARKTVFEGLFDTLIETGGGERVPRPPSGFRFALLPVEVHPPIESTGQRTSPDIYADDIPATAEPWSFEPASIARMLGLREGMTVEEISQVRRAFAQRNHPDLIPDGLRDVATARMQAINAVLDEHLKALDESGRFKPGEPR